MSWTTQQGAIRRDALGLALYAAAFGASFGAVSVAAGLSVGQTMVLSLLMFTGASQFAFVGVIGAGGAPLAAIPAALLLGVRNSFYGVSMSRILDLRRRRDAAIAAQFVIDETTAMAVTRDDPRAARYAFWTTGISLFLLWNLGTLAGALGGAALGNPEVLGLDAAVPAAFLALLWPRLNQAATRIAAALGAALAIVLVPVLPAGIPVLAAAPIAVAFGLSRRTGSNNLREAS